MLYFYLTKNIFIPLYYNMSESRAFANYSNVSRQLQQTAGQQQEGPTIEDKLNDAKNFEQQFLIGMAVHQKVKVGDQLVKVFKGSKKLQSATGLSEEDLAGIAKGDFSGVSGKIAKATSKKLRQSIKSLRDAKSQNASDATELEARKTLQGVKKSVSDKLKAEKTQADGEVSDAQRTAEAADAEVQRLANMPKPADADALEDTARGLRATADADKSAAELAQRAADSTLPTRAAAQSTEDDVRLEPNPDYDDAVNEAQRLGSKAAQSDTLASEAENAAGAARTATTSLATQQSSAFDAALDAQRALAAKTAAAASKAADADAATASADSATADVAGIESTVASGVSKASKISSDIAKASEGVAEGSEFDPLGLLVAGIGAIAATLIGRAVKTHTPVNIAPPPISSSYASTLGA